MTARIVGVAVVVSVASALRTSRKSVSKEVAPGAWQLEPPLTPCAASSESCQPPPLVERAVRFLAQQFIQKVVTPRDPGSFSFPDISKEVNLWGCGASVEISTRLEYSGFGHPEIGGVNCEAYKCIESGAFGLCKIAHYDFDFGLSLENEVRMDGIADANWSLCGMSLPNTTTMIGGGFRKAGLSTKVRAEFQNPLLGGEPVAKIVDLLDLRIDPGEHAGTRCGFSSLPNFIGSRLERWCESFGDWLFRKSKDTVQPLIDDALKQMIGEEVVEDDKGILHHRKGN